jgi:hypothetical protein
LIRFLGHSLIPCAAALVFLASAGLCAPKPAITHVIFVMTDGLRWQEVFSGAEESLMTKENGAVKDVEALRNAYWRETPEERREALMPFVWSEIGGKGQLYGNRTLGSEAYVTNGHNFSYPGYSETLCGFPDPRIDSNDKIPNPNVTVLEWLDRKPAFRGKVAGFGAWDVISGILNDTRARFPINAGFDPFTVPPVTPRLEVLNQIKTEATRVLGNEAFDFFPFHTASEYLRLHKPRVLYIEFIETDAWAHAGHYGDYLNAAHRVDQYLKALWDTVQSMPGYRGHTALIFSPDHGRGSAPVEWRSHGEKIPDSKYIWMAFLGPGIRPLGERAHIAPVTQSQVAATLAGLLGEDYPAAVPKAGKPIADVVSH